MSLNVKKTTNSYRDELDAMSKHRYMQKINIIDDVDPYNIEKSSLMTNIDLWASVTYPDIVNYLLFTTSAYTMDELKSYKSLEAYNQFINGWVQEVKVKIINNLCVHIGKVRPY